MPEPRHDQISITDYQSTWVSCHLNHHFRFVAVHLDCSVLFLDILIILHLQQSVPVEHSCQHLHYIFLEICEIVDLFCYVQYIILI